MTMGPQLKNIEMNEGRGLDGGLNTCTDATWMR
jgi:hypothetical protein